MNISLPDEIYRQAKEAELNISRLARKAILQELSDRAKLAAAYEYLDEVERELGPISADEHERARQWAEKVFGPESKRRSA